MKSWILLAVAAAPLGAQTGAELFEKSIRPVLVNKCYGCHSSQSKIPMGGLLLDTKAGLKKGGASGAIVVPGDPGASRLMRALSYSDAQLRMPPTGKLSDTDIAAFEKWIAAGATDKEYYEQDGADHYFRPLAAGDADPRDRLADACVLPWLRARFTA